MVSIYTNNPDCEHDWFTIDETLEVAESTVKEANISLMAEKRKYKIVRI